MKKLLAILLTLLMLASLSVPVFADGEELFDMALPQTGITLHIPWEYLTGHNTLGVLELMTAEEVRYNSGIYYTQLIYVRQGDVFDPDACAPYLTFLCLRNNCDQSMPAPLPPPAPRTASSVWMRAAAPSWAQRSSSAPTRSA